MQHAKTAGCFDFLKKKCHFQSQDKFIQKESCEYFGSKPSIAVLGDSHAVEIAYSLAANLKPDGLSINHNTMSSCGYYLKGSNYEKIPQIKEICNKWLQNVLDKILRNDSLRVIVISFRNEYRLREASYRDELAKMLNNLVENGKRVIYVYQAPLPILHIDKYLKKSVALKIKNIYGHHEDKWDEIYKGKKDLEEIVSEQVIFIDPKNIFCENKRCHVVKDGQALYFDDHHMSIFGSNLISHQIVKSL